MPKKPTYTTDDTNSEALALHKKFTGKLETVAKMGRVPKKLLPLVYTPGVAAVCQAIAKQPELAYTHTLKGRTVAVVSDGSAVLGLGNIGPLAGLPVMEGKSLLLKEFGGVDSFPLVLNTQVPEEIITFVRQVSPTFAGINLEDIKAPGCFQVEEALQDIGIPVFHDDQHGTAIVVKAALLNAAKVVGKPFTSLNVVIVGAGAAGLSVARMLLGLECLGKTCSLVPKVSRVNDVIVVDRLGALVSGRDKQNMYKQSLADSSNKRMLAGSLAKVAKNADVIIGVSGPGAIAPEIIQNMASKPIVFALANPIPEIDPELAKQAGAVVIATGRSGMPSQINNVLAFPGIFRAVIQGRLPKITQTMKQAAAQALADCIENPTATNIIPTPFHPGLAEVVAQAVLGVE